MTAHKLAVCILALPLLLTAQDDAVVRRVLDRLERLEEQNRAMAEEIRQLRQQLAAAHSVPSPPATAPPTMEERLDVQESRLQELAQTRVSSENHHSISLGGMLLFNAYRNGRANGDNLNPTTASLNAGNNLGGATVRQSVLGLRFNGPQIFAGGKVSGALFMDFFAGTGGVLNQQMRIRVATVDLDWRNTTLSFGQDKPLIATREPESLAQVGVSPLTGAGNLWLWLPQVRAERRFSAGDSMGFKAQGSVLQTSEGGTGLTGEYAEGLSRARPGYEARGEFWRKFGAHGRLELAPGVHYSETHVLGRKVPTRIFAADWLVRPAQKFDFTGTYFRGGNTGVLGGLRQGVFIEEPYDRPRAAHSTGGFAQFTWRATRRISFNLFGGMEDFRRSDVAAGQIDRNQTLAANIYYRLSSNVITSFEASRVRTTYAGGPVRKNPHYDLAIAYIF